MKVLSIVIPAYDEERYIGAVLDRIRAVDFARLGYTSELIVVDDGSRDRTADIAGAGPDVRLLRRGRHVGKGAAVRAGLAVSTGDVVIIQDADMEYDPQDHLRLLDAVVTGGASVVYGSRYLLGGRRPNQAWAAYLGGRSLSVMAGLLTGVFLTDTSTGLKMMTREVLVALDLHADGFELDHEITAKIIGRGLKIVEVPISYAPRSRAEGKKIGALDWFSAVRTLWRCS